MKRILLFSIVFTFVLPLHAHIHGVVVDNNGESLAGANLHWHGTTVGTTSDADGSFEIEPVHATRMLVASFIGYRSDTVEVVSESQQVVIVLVSEDTELDDVTIAARRQAVVRSRFATFNSEKLTSAELCKAACCNLSESFETSAAVDVAYADAATGAKQIRLLGLSGTYVQLLSENTPGIRGLAQSFGMEYIPGPWMESIQVSKGTSSVVNGYESVTGQINVEYLKPKTQDPIAVNLMLNSELHAEVNLTGGWDVSSKELKENPLRGNNGVYTGVLAHYRNGSWAMDHNHDTFLDMPTSQQLNLLNRWEFFHDDYTGRLLVRGLYDRRKGGQREPSFDKHAMPEEPYLIDLSARRIEGFMKNGYVIDDETGMSVGIITSGSYHSQDNSYGDRRWHATEANAYLNAMFQTDLGDESELTGERLHKLTAGLSLNHDTYSELLTGLIPRDVSLPADALLKINALDLSRRQTDVGLFAEYTFSPNDKLTLLAGIRADLTIRQCKRAQAQGLAYTTEGVAPSVKVLPTPRLNIRYAPWAWWTLRASAGMGYRTPNILSDNAQQLSTGKWITTPAQAKGVTEFGPEAWSPSSWAILSPNIESALNAGVSTTFYIPIGERELQLSAEYYYTHFFECLIADTETPERLYFYNLTDVDGARAFAHTWQVEADMEVLRGWTWTLAFRQNDSRQTVLSPTSGEFVLRERPLQNKFKAIITTSYQTPLKKWQFDLTAQFNGAGRMPEGFVIPAGAEKQYFTKDQQTYHQWYPQLLGQITKYWRTCSLYVGAENMTNFCQQQPIIGATEPFGSAFDAATVWAPISGWKAYIGFRWNLQASDD